ncbi:MAG: GtrA family protein [Methyloceanibacter sp.]
MTVWASSLLRIPKWREITASVRYIGVGATCAVLNNIFLIAVVAAGFDYLSGSLVVCLPMLIIGFALHTSVTFETPPTIIAFLRYSAAMLATYPIWIVSLFLLCDVARLPIIAASLIATVFLFFWNYVFTHWAILRSLRTTWMWRWPPNRANSS